MQKDTYLETSNCDCLSKLPSIDKESIDLVIADPPYFKIINEIWDYKWRTLNEYLQWSSAWLEQVYQALRYGGSLFLFGYFRHLAHILPIAEGLGFELRQQIIINKGIKSVAGRKTSTYKMFPNTTESILFFIKDNKQIIKPLFKNRAKELGLTSKQINERLGVKSNGGGMWSIYTGKNICEQFPTQKTWNKLMDILELNIEYSDYAQTYNPIMGLTDVWSDLDFYAKNRIHPTEKPYKLIERIIQATTNKNDTVLDLFSGSGITGIVAKKLGRNAILYEIHEEYFAKAITRFNDANIDYIIR